MARILGLVVAFLAFAGIIAHMIGYNFFAFDMRHGLVGAGVALIVLVIVTNFDKLKKYQEWF